MNTYLKSRGRMAMPACFSTKCRGWSIRSAICLASWTRMWRSPLSMRDRLAGSMCM